MKKLTIIFISFYAWFAFEQYEYEQEELIEYQNY